MSEWSLGAPGTQLVTADGIVGRSGKPVRVYSIHIISGGTAGIVNLRNGPAVTDTIWTTSTGVIDTGVNFFFAEGIRFPLGCFVDVDANVTSVAVTFSTEN